MTLDDTALDQQTMKLADGFTALTQSQWQDLAAAALNRGRPPERHIDGHAAQLRLRTTTVDDLVIEPLYTASEHQRPVGYPGVMPFTRGGGLRDPQAPWHVRALHTDPDARAAREAILLDLERGVTSVWLHVGAGSLAADDLGEALTDVLLELAPVVVTGLEDDQSAAAALQHVWRHRGIADDQALGNLGYDPLARVARTDEHQAYDEHIAQMVRAGQHCLQHTPGVRAGTVDALPYHDAGAGDIEEVGCAIATGIAYLRSFEAGGIGPTDAANQLEFRIAASADQFLTIAKLRALRRLWARVGEVCETVETGRGAQIHAVTSWRTTTRDDPWVNILRGTVACFGAAVGGADAVTVLPFDAAWGLPDVLARRVARNTQILIAEEASIGRVTDPAGGSWYVEQLTDDLASAAWAWVQRIEADGGMAAALRDGLVAERIEAVAAHRSARLRDRRQTITGVSAFPHPSEPPLQRRPAPTSPSAAGGLPVRRDAEPFEALRDRARAHLAATGSAPQVLLACLGTRRDFGPREMFAGNLTGIAGILTHRVETVNAVDLGPAAGSSELAEGTPPVALLCSSAAVYAEHGQAALEALREAGLVVYVTGRPQEFPAADDAGKPGAAGFLYEGIDVVDILTRILDDLGVAR